MQLSQHVYDRVATVAVVDWIFEATRRVETALGRTVRWSRIAVAAEAETDRADPDLVGLSHEMPSSP
jgi:hypothetical protein